MNAIELMEDAVRRDVSDIHLKVDNPPIYRMDGELIRLDGDALDEEAVMSFLEAITAPEDIAKFRKVLELDASYTLPGKARFRINASKDDGCTRVVLRLIPLIIKTIDELELPPVLHKICMYQNGLVLVTGVTGSGKSTTLAALIDEINEKRAAHVVTIEDPLEFVHLDKKSVISQREVGRDTLSFANALRGALRQDPDVILIGEMRDAETVRTALSSAETGHLVFSTLHTVDAVETLNRIIDFFDPHQQPQIRKQLASVMRAVISQRLVQRKETPTRTAVAEILIGSRTVRDYIEQGKSFKDINSLIEEGADQWGMQTFDQHLYSLYQAGVITDKVAILNASKPRDVKLRIDGLREN